MRGSKALFGKLKPLGIGAWLFALALAAVLPVLLFAGIAAQRLATAERQATLTELERRAQATANVVQRYLQSLRELAGTLAAAPMSQSGDLRSFYDYAKRAMAAGNVGRAVVLADPGGRMLVNTRRPFGELLPSAGDVQGLAAALAGKTVHIGNLFKGAVSGVHVFTAWAPVIRDGQVVSLVGVVVEPKDLTAVLLEERLLEGWTSVVFDRRGTFVARSVEPDKWVGQPAPPETLAAQAQGERGAYSITTLAGVGVSAYFVKIPTSGWAVAVGVPKRQLEAPTSATVRYMLGLGLASLLVAGGLAFLVGRHMNRAVASVVDAAIAVGEGRQLETRPSGVHELDELSGALVAAHDLIAAREASLRESEADFRGYFENVAVGTAQVDPSGCFMRVNQRYCEIVGYSREELLAGMGPLDLDHPDDREADKVRFARFFEGLVPVYEAEKRYVRKDGHTVWVRVSARNVHDGPDNQRGYTAGVIEDITERKQAEEHAALLMKEVNHRAKNLLAVAQAVARQSADTSEQMLFAEQFSERLAGMAASHDLLVRSEWQGVDAGDLVRSQLAHFANLIGTRVTLDGPSVQLTATTAQPIGMAIHELATNAGKYGALANADGTIRIEWELVAAAAGGQGGAQRFRMQWSEHGGPPTTPPERRGFGHQVIVDAIEHSLGAEVSLAYPPSGLVWQLEAPAERICTKVLDRVATPSKN